MRLQNKSAVVTGAASGIGAATARAFAREGAAVLLADRDTERGEALAAAIRMGGGTAHFLTADMGDKSAIEGMITLAVERFGKLDILHNNTAAGTPGAVCDISVDQWDQALKISLTSYWYASRCAMPHMVAAGGGAIVNTASISGIAADYNLGAYNTVKGAIVNMSRSIAIDYASHNIRCNAVCPGIIFTPPFQEMRKIHPAIIEKLAASVPLGRFGTADEIANVFVFLASDEASFVTGATIVADGGRTAWTGTPDFTEGLNF